MKNKKLTIISILVVIATIAGGYFIYKHNIADRYNKAEGSINYGPPTKEEKSAGEDRKHMIDEENRQQELPSTTNQQHSKKKEVSVIITDASQYDDIIEVRSFIPDHYEDGTCTITISKDSRSITKSSPAYKDISTTICTNPEIQRSEFSQVGKWTVLVSFDSKGAKGISEPHIINIK